jgi:hypothetical protein
MYPLVEPEWEFESLTADEARVVAHYDEGTEYASAELTLFKRYGELFYDVLYSCPEESWDALYGVFKKSSETLLMGTGLPGDQLL